MQSIVTITVVLFSLTLLLGASSLSVNKGWISGESARKLVHVGMGCICMIFPWLFDSALPVQILGGIAVILIFTIRASRLRSSLGSSLFTVQRLSIGELLFPIAVAWLFTLYKVNQVTAVYYVIPLLLLTLADTAGAIFGTRIGKRIYKTSSGTKSVEGSIAFFLTAFLCTIIPLCFFTSHELSHIVFAAFAVALFFTLVEGACGAGLDNLLIPVGAYFLLIYYLEQSSESLWLKAVVLFLILLLFILTRTKHSLNGGASLSACLLCFISFTMGGVYCLAASLLLLIRHMMALKKTPEKLRHTHSIEAVVAVGAPAITWLTLGRGDVIDESLSRLLFIASLATTIGMLHVGTRKFLTKSGLTINRICVANLMAAIILLLSYPIIHSMSFYNFAVPFVALPNILFHYVRSDEPSVLSDWVKLYLITSISSFLLYYSYAATY